jgi:cyclopropane-fatty-acyl-phospholipid synthase
MQTMRIVPEDAAPRASASIELQEFLAATLRRFPWRIRIRDWTGERYAVGGNGRHWRGGDLEIDVKSEGAARDVLGLRGSAILERFVAGEIGMEGNLYLLTWIRLHANLELGVVATALQVFRNRAFQSEERARINVKSHYDLPDAFFSYLDRAYRSYSCGIFERPEDLRVEDLLRVGHAKGDAWDSLEAAQHRKFADAADYVRPAPGETVLDIGCGYGGQLIVGAERYPEARWYGWTHSSNQAKDGNARLDAAGVGGRSLLREGDYRNDTRRYDHALSTGMACHVGPRGLVPYVRKVRSLLRKDGRYMHHVIMNPWSLRPLDSYVGVAFNKKYVWPGFHWFSVGDHMKALEKNGFRIMAERNLQAHYAKTTAAWYERMMADEERLRALVGDQTFRAFQIYLSGSSAGFSSRQIEVHRIYCEAR